MNYIPILIYSKKKQQFFQKNVNTTNAFSLQFTICRLVLTCVYRHVFFSALPWPFHTGPGHSSRFVACIDGPFAKIL